MRRYVLTNYCMSLRAASAAPSRAGQPAAQPEAQIEVQSDEAIVPGIEGGQGHSDRALEVSAYVLTCAAVGAGLGLAISLLPQLVQLCSR